ncbi:fungal-specific transcription factor domain-containing protein [Mycena latifolia]|nr:fungal-specific transcription factor domain-containing protein [Mycena latifolia]
MSSIKEDSPSPKALGDNDDYANIRDPLSSLIPDAKHDSLYYGKSSSVQFIKSAIKHIHGNTSIVVGVQRPEFWTTQPWEKLVIETPQQVFPENDLLINLVNIYFEQINPIVSILHSPSFRQSIVEGLHFRDQHFGAVVLAVCSLASRSSDDPRVFLDEGNSEHSCGWKWFRQVRPLRTSFSPTPSLHQLQLICLSVLYLAGTSHPEECWILAGLGLRCAQGAGAHHRSGYSHMSPLEAELYKRVFYILVAEDSLMNSFKGRPSITHSVDFDLDLPLDCDEEYWEIPNAVQPRGKPSASAFLVAYVPLMMIFGRIQRAVYPVNGQPPSADIIAELDSELNGWVSALPAHLRWDPNQGNLVMVFALFFGAAVSYAWLQVFLRQSAALYASYYHAQILIHRPFIPAPGKEAMPNTNFPSLAICANAARSCGHVLDVQTRRCPEILHHPQVSTVLFDCAVNATTAPPLTFKIVCAYSDFTNDGRKYDIIAAMLNIGKYTSDGPSLKRPREMEEITTSHGASEVLLTHPEEHPVAGTSEVMFATQQIEALELSIRETDHLFSLPLSTEELGCLPIYDSFDYEFTFQPDDLQHEPQSHLDSQDDEMFGLIDPEFLYGESPSAIGSNFHPQPTTGGGPPGMQADHSFDIPSSNAWQDWSTYLTNVDGLN